MENENVENVQSDNESVSQSSEVSEGTSEVSNSDFESVNDNVSSDVHFEVLDESEEVVQEYDSVEVFGESKEVIDESEEVVDEPKSTVIQVVPDMESDSGYNTYELDVDSLNQFTQSYIEQSLAVTPTSNDYYTFIDSQVSEYFSGVMANYPFNEYKAYHLRHWVYNSQYSSYYDDYYFLYYDLPSDECIQIYKGYNSNQYVVTNGRAEILSSTITYGSDVGQSDLREGVSYVTWLSSLCVLGGVLVLYIVNAIFKHLRS